MTYWAALAAKNLKTIMMSFDTKKIKSKHDRCKLWDVNSTYTYGILKNTSCNWSSSKYVSVFCVPKKVKCDVSVITVHLTNEMKVNFYNMLIAFNNIQGIVKLRQGSGKDRQGMAVKAKGLKA